MVLLFEPGTSFVLHFYACLRARVIAVPCYPPTPNKLEQSINVITKVIESSSSNIVVLSKKVSQLKSLLGSWPTNLKHGSIQYICFEDSVNDVQVDDRQIVPFPESSDIAFLQYTSGSTGDPKGVVIGHDNFQCNLMTSSYWMKHKHSQNYRYHHEDPMIGVSWLPLYHGKNDVFK